MLGLHGTPRTDQALLRLLLNHLPHCAAAIFDRDLRIVCAGGELLPALGVTADIEGKYVSELFEPDRADLVTRWFMSALQGEAMHTTWPFNEERLLSITVRPVRGAKGDNQPLGAVIVQTVQPVSSAQTNELREEHKRASMLKDLELMQTKARIIERILHEFRNPLATVASSAELLRAYGDAMPDEKRNEHVERISSEAHRLAHILDDILTLFS